MRLLKYGPRKRADRNSMAEMAMKSLDIAALALFDDLQSVRPLNLPISDYSKRYLSDKIGSLESELSRDTHIIRCALRDTCKSLEEIVLVDYGGGTGVLSLLAKKLGVGTVIYNDIYDVSCRDARKIADVLGCAADYYVAGDIDDLVDFLSNRGLKSDAVVSYDVLEHIYDIDEFLRKLHLISREGSAMMLCSGANILNYPIVKSEILAQIKAENEGIEEKWGHKKRDTLMAYAQVRAQIIREYAPKLIDDEADELAARTRGLMRGHILNCVDAYIDVGDFPVKIEHPTNTCDPYTGNWMEHLMNPYYLMETLSAHAFDVEVLPGFWGHRSHPLKNVITNLLDFFIRVSPRYVGMHFSPYYSLYAKYNGIFIDEKHKHHMYQCRHSPLYHSVRVLWEVLSYLRP